MHGLYKEINYGLIMADQGIGTRNSEEWSENSFCLKN
jgi:hypothetical protein